jgi:hypothetical protein
VFAPQSQIACCPVAHQWHDPQLGMKEQTMWSPGATRVTPGPTSSTTPAPSCPSTIGSQPAISPLSTCRSEWQSPACV